MTSSEHPSYKDRDRVPVLEQQISDLKMLTSHQSLTIKRLQEEGIAKADRITALLGADTRGVHGSLGGDLGAPLHRPQPATHRPPAPAQACDVLYICIHSYVWRRTCTFTATMWRR